jgi:hypothetical protein
MLLWLEEVALWPWIPRRFLFIVALSRMEQMACLHQMQQHSCSIGTEAIHSFMLAWMLVPSTILVPI